MRRCSIKRGFFNLRDCGAQSLSACATCSRPMCQEHSTQHGSALLCLDCYARQEDSAQQQVYDSRWAYAGRRHYYAGSSYRPFYWGARYDHYYDDYDVRSFEREESDPQFDEAHESVGFWDS